MCADVGVGVSVDVSVGVIYMYDVYKHISVRVSVQIPKRPNLLVNRSAALERGRPPKKRKKERKRERGHYRLWANLCKSINESVCCNVLHR